MSNESKNAEARESYRYYREHRICISCRCERAVRGSVYCLGCREKKRERERNRYKMMSEAEKEERRAKVRIYHKQLRAKRLAQGICPHCGRRKLAEGKAACPICAAKRNALQRKRRGGGVRAVWELEGRCRNCGEPVVPGYKLCEKHLAIARLNRMKGTLASLGSAAYQSEREQFLKWLKLCSGKRGVPAM